MPYYATIDEDLARAKEILEKGRMREEDLPTHVSEGLRKRLLLSGGHIFGADIFAAYKLLQSFVEHIDTHFRPDHNGECLNCDNWEDSHGLRDQAESYQLLLALLGATDYKSAVLAVKALKDR